MSSANQAETFHKGPQTHKTLDDFHVWPVKHRHWQFEIAESEAHEVWVRTSDLRLFWPKFPDDRQLRQTHSRSLLYASRDKIYYISQRSMRQLLQRSRTQSIYPDVLKFLDWFDRNVSRVAESKRVNHQLEQVNSFREQHAQDIQIGPLPPHRASPTLDESTLMQEPLSKWAMEHEDSDTPRVFHPDARIIRTNWAQWSKEQAAGLGRWWLEWFCGQKHLLLTYVLALCVAALPGRLAYLLLPAGLDVTQDYARLLWGEALLTLVSVILIIMCVVAVSRFTWRAFGLHGGKLWATAIYAMFLPWWPTVVIGNSDQELLENWWDLVRGNYRPVAVEVDPHLGRIVLRGEMKFGSSEALRSVLEHNPGYTLVELESPGGYVIEGERMAQLIAKRGLDTVAFDQCASACTLLFASGKDRYLGAQVQMGFHRSGTRYGPIGSGWSNTDYRMADYYAQRGVNEGFIRRALKPSNAEIWWAPHPDMYAAGYATLRWSERKSGY
jgi:hypothetical protein